MAMRYDPYATALELLDKGGTVREDLGERERAAIRAAVERLTTGSADLSRLLREHQPPVRGTGS